MRSEAPAPAATVCRSLLADPVDSSVGGGEAEWAQLNMMNDRGESASRLLSMVGLLRSSSMLVLEESLLGRHLARNEVTEVFELVPKQSELFLRLTGALAPCSNRPQLPGRLLWC